MDARQAAPFRSPSCARHAGDRVGIPDAPKPLTPMAADADPSFDVGHDQAESLRSAGPARGFTMNGRDIVVRNGSLADLIDAAYSVQTKQMVNGPGWMESDRYDIHAIPDQPGAPISCSSGPFSESCWRTGIKIKIHHEKRNIAAYVLTVGKTGQKLTPTQSKGNLQRVAVPRQEPAA